MKHRLLFSSKSLTVTLVPQRQVCYCNIKDEKGKLGGYLPDEQEERTDLWPPEGTEGLPDNLTE